MTAHPDLVERLILVDEDDCVLRASQKLEAHRTGALHRAFSVFIFRSDGKLIVQKRAAGKYHSAGKWANTACGHPRPGEDVVSAAERRLEEETGLRAALQTGFKARYRADLDNGMIENELVHVVFGISDEDGAPDPGEVSALAETSLDALRQDLARRPGRYAVWLVKYFERHAEQIFAKRDELVGAR
ncbi:MAG: isopentenyl-diphosphate Delta-isomerase [Pseudomonadota bacterium]